MDCGDWAALNCEAFVLRMPWEEAKVVETVVAHVIGRATVRVCRRGRHGAGFRAGWKRAKNTDATLLEADGEKWPSRIFHTFLLRRVGLAGRGMPPEAALRTGTVRYKQH